MIEDNLDLLARLASQEKRYDTHILCMGSFCPSSVYIQPLVSDGIYHTLSLSPSLDVAVL